MEWEFRVLDWMRRHRCRLLDFSMPFFTSIGNAGFVWHLLSLCLVLAEPTRLCGLCTFCGAMIASGFANLVIKPLAGRPRPCDRRPEIGHLTKKPPHGTSFPSGHATTSFGGAVGGMIGMLWTLGPVAAAWFGGATLLLALCISYSRMYLYVHFPTDVLAGIVIGTAFGCGVPFGVVAVYQLVLSL